MHPQGAGRMPEHPYKYTCPNSSVWNHKRESPCINEEKVSTLEKRRTEQPGYTTIGIKACLNL